MAGWPGGKVTPAAPYYAPSKPLAVSTIARRDNLTPQRIEPKFSAWNFSYDLNLSYKLAPDVLAYATYAKSFKPGGINLNGVPNDASGNPQVQVGAIKPESVDHYEVGLKTSFWDRRAILNLAAFRTDIRNFQALNRGSIRCGVRLSRRAAVRMSVIGALVTGSRNSTGWPWPSNTVRSYSPSFLS